MTSAELKSELETIITNINSGASIASAFAPQFSAFIAIGMAVDKLIPGIAADVASWVQAKEPTEEEKSDMAAKLAILGNPKAP
jgi:hypothetical protein